MAQIILHLCKYDLRHMTRPTNEEVAICRKANLRIPNWVEHSESCYAAELCGKLFNVACFLRLNIL